MPIEVIDVCANNHGGDEMSEAAYLAASRTGVAEAILDFMGRHEIVVVPVEVICDDVVRELGIANQTASPAMSNLLRLGLIVRTTKTKLTALGCKARVCVLAKFAHLYTVVPYKARATKSVLGAYGKASGGADGGGDKS